MSDFYTSHVRGQIRPLLFCQAQEKPRVQRKREQTIHNLSTEYLPHQSQLRYAHNTSLQKELGELPRSQLSPLTCILVTSLLHTGIWLPRCEIPSFHACTSRGRKGKHEARRGSARCTAASQAKPSGTGLEEVSLCPCAPQAGCSPCDLVSLTAPSQCHHGLSASPLRDKLLLSWWQLAVVLPQLKEFFPFLYKLNHAQH